MAVAAVAGAASPRQPALDGERNLLSHTESTSATASYELQGCTFARFVWGSASHTISYEDGYVLLENSVHPNLHLPIR